MIEHMRRTYGIALVIAIASMLGTATAQPAVFVDIGNRGSLQDAGHAVVVPVRVACPSEPSGGIQENRLEVRQMQRETLVVAVGGTGDITCDGSIQRLRITAHVEEPTHSFRPGPAIANMFVLICDESGAQCIQGDVTEDLLIVGR